MHRSGFFLVLPSNVGTVAKRCPGVTGLNFFSPTSTNPPDYRTSESVSLGQRFQVNLLARRECHHSFLDPAGGNVVLPPPPLPSVNRDGVDLHHPHVEQPLHRVFDGRLVGSGGHLERVPPGLGPTHALLSQDRPADQHPRIGHCPNTSTSAATAGRVRTTRSALRRSWTLSDVAGRTVTSGRVQADRTMTASGTGVMIRVFPPAGSCRSSPAITLVRGGSNTSGPVATDCPAAALAESAEPTARWRTFCGVRCV